MLGGGIQGRDGELHPRVDARGEGGVRRGGVQRSRGGALRGDCDERETNGFGFVRGEGVWARPWVSDASNGASRPVDDGSEGLSSLGAGVGGGRSIRGARRSRSFPSRRRGVKSEGGVGDARYRARRWRRRRRPSRSRRRRSARSRWGGRSAEGARRVGQKITNRGSIAKRAAGGGGGRADRDAPRRRLGARAAARPGGDEALERGGVVGGTVRRMSFRFPMGPEADAAGAGVGAPSARRASSSARARGRRRGGRRRGGVAAGGAAAGRARRARGLFRLGVVAAHGRGGV